MKYGLTIDNQNYIIEKAKIKKDGVYQIRGVIYNVKDKHVEYFIDANNNILQSYGAFNVVCGKLECEYRQDRIKYAKKYFKKLESE